MSQLCMIAFLRSSGPWPLFLWQWNTLVPSRIAPEQFTRVSGSTPAFISASPFIGLTVEPGGYSPCVTLFISGT